MDFTGRSIGRYQVLESLGKGGMATVYKAYDTNLERDVAIKFIRRDALPAEQLEGTLKRFEREAKALARLSHPNIVGIMDYGEYEDSPYLVMEYLPGGTLKKLLGEPIPWQQATRLLLPIAHALDYAHEHHIVHRDIKPSNILLTEKGQTMLSDFGIAKILEGSDSQTLTSTGIGVGTPEYMAPEQWTGQADRLSDIYSLGVVLYELVTGVKPFMADTPAAILLKQASEPLPRPRSLVASIPETLEMVLLKALARNPQDRYENMADLAEAMEKLLDARNEIEVPAIKAVRDTSSVMTNQDVSRNAAKGTKGPDIPLALTSPEFMQRKEQAKSTYKSTRNKYLLPAVIGIGFGCILLTIIGGLVYMGIGGQGPLAGLATATRIPTRTPISMVGNWTIYFSWDCTGNYSSGELTFYSDNTYNVNDDPALWGTWFTVADYVDFTFDEYPNSHYIGNLSSSGDYTEGTMDNLDEMSGCWYASR